MKEILKKIGLGGLVVAGFGAGIFLSIIRLIFVAGAALAVIYCGINMIFNGYIIWGLLVLLIGTPVAVAIVSFIFPFWVLLCIIYGIYRLIVYLL